MKWFRRINHLNGLECQGRLKLWMERRMNGKPDPCTAPCYSRCDKNLANFMPIRTTVQQTPKYKCTAKFIHIHVLKHLTTIAKTVYSALWNEKKDLSTDTSSSFSGIKQDKWAFVKLIFCHMPQIMNMHFLVKKQIVKHWQAISFGQHFKQIIKQRMLLFTKHWQILLTLLNYQKADDKILVCKIKKKS